MTTIPVSTVTTTVSAIASLTAGVPPLTTVFTAPASCSTNWVFPTDITGTVWGDINFIPHFSLCQPYDNYGTVYAPAICGEGLELKQVTKLIETGWDSPVTNWHGLCCSSNFDVSILYGTSSFCIGSFSAPFAALVSNDIGNPSFGFRTTVLTTDVLAVSDFLEVYWHESDVVSFPTDSQVQLRAIMGLSTATSSVLSGATTSITTLPQTTPTAPQSIPTATTTELQNGLSTGAVAGISVAIAFLVIVIVILSYFACFRRRWRSSSQGSPHSRQQKYGLGSGSVPSKQRSFWSRLFRNSSPQTGSPASVVTEVPSVSELDSPPELGKSFKNGAWRSELHFDSAAARREERGFRRPLNDMGEERTGRLNWSASSHQNMAPVELEASSPLGQ